VLTKKLTPLGEQLERFLVRPADGRPVGIREENALRHFVEWCDEVEPPIIVRPKGLPPLERAIEVIVLRAIFEPNLLHNEIFRSREALARECDPKQVGIHAAADSRAKFKHFATHGDWQVSREQVNDELLLLAEEVNAELLLLEGL
jgi:hypothetical protein